MSIHPKFPAFDEAAQKEFAASAKELLNGLFEAYRSATEIFLANPTTKRWRARVQIHAAWAVASRAEDGETTHPPRESLATGTE